MADVNQLAQMANLELDIDISDDSLLDYTNPEEEDVPTPVDGARTHQQYGAATRAVATGSESETEEYTQPLTRTLDSTVSFGSARTMTSGRFIQSFGSTPTMPSNRPAVATAVTAMDDMERIDEEEGSPQFNSSSSTTKFKKGVLKNSNNPGRTVSSRGARNKNQLSLTSAKYDLDGDGVLDEVEQAMRDHDHDGDGQLDNA
eukprot:CAMPEP_0201961486 /NCGR_PEP_ID=MMETSP0904-20121228/7923_1 /ASSEMBLY_ACC=CAM_ASM_000553 /TAXON_ID=420261 /ORGANISM="Thalassiosira antarctica, Strain CCMP982" /LENGTH=201 /DNA_ID=CAMNT_0048507669 /DNA_START=173 /DNA_END=774 /DNA_ORIENTATION=+